MDTAHDYLAAILRRAREQMEPRDFNPDWSDRPRKTKFYPDVEYCEPPYSDLPYGGSTSPTGTVDRWLTPADDGPGFSLQSLSDMLLDSYGHHARRLAIHANSDVDSLPYYPGATWARGTASGGGLYPVSVYWVSGASGPVVPGVYFYSTTQRAFQRLLTGDVSRVVEDAVGGSAETDQFLVLGVKFWQNAFKYNSFNYHAVTMDVGTVLQTWRMWAGAHGLTLAPFLWFDDERVSSLLGVEQDAEAMMAVVPLRWNNDDRPDAAAPADPARPVTTAPAPRVRYTDQERSRRVHRFDFPLAVDRASRRTTSDRPQWIELAGALPVPPRPDAVRVALPERLPLDVSMRHALRSRRSSFGRFAAAPAMTAAQLSSLLAGVSAAARFECDLGGSSPLAKFYVFANHITGVTPGAYEFDPATNELCLASPGAHGGFLQRNYFLDNYNVEQAAAVIVPTIRAAAVLDAVGARGYRLVNAVVGAVAQAAYTVAAAVGLGCGVALGFDNISYIDELSLEETGDVPLLIMMIGRERALPADYRFELV